MAEELAKIDQPIDVMYLIHKALSAEAERVQELIEEYKIGDSLQPFRAAFDFWATTLIYHADVEDRYMTAPMMDFQPARVNEAEHADIKDLLADLEAYAERGDRKDLEGRVKAAVVALHEEQHTELMDRLEDVLAVLNQEIGRSKVVARTRRHLFGKVVALKICQDDHLESEEAFILPEIRERLSEEEQLAMAKRLLIDEAAEDPRWIIDWVSRELPPGERALLADLKDRFESVASLTD